MKTLQLKKINNFAYKEMLEGILKNAPEQGFTIDQIRKSVKAIEALDKAKDSVEFEDDIAEHVKQMIMTAKFRIATSEIVSFIDDIEKL